MVKVKIIKQAGETGLRSVNSIMMLDEKKAVALEKKGLVSIEVKPKPDEPKPAEPHKRKSKK